MDINHRRTVHDKLNMYSIERPNSDLRRVRSLRRLSRFLPLLESLNPPPSLLLQGISFSTSRFAPYKILVLVLGACAILVGIAVLLFMPDSPVHAPFLSHEERIAALERVRDDQGGTENGKLKRAQVVEALQDVRTWLIVLSTLVSKSKAMCNECRW